MNRRRLLTTTLGTLVAARVGAATSEDESLMRAVRMTARGGPETLRMDRIPVPVVGSEQVRIRVRAAGVNPADTWRREDLEAHEVLRIPGFDAAGVIDRVGQGVTGWRVGDAVVALVRKPYGAYADYVLAMAEDLAPKPRTMTFEEAAGIPCVGFTSWRYLVEMAKVSRGHKVLIHGGAGGTGSAAVQIAKAHGATVVATASARNHDYLRSIGADHVIDYNTTRFESVVTDADIVFDTVGGETLKRSAAAVRPGGTLLSITDLIAPETCSAKPQLRCRGWSSTPDEAAGPRLREIVRLADAGKYKVNVDAVFPLEEAAAAQTLNRRGHTRGKIVLRVTTG